MGYLSRVQDTIKDVIGWLVDKSEPATAMRCWEAFHLGYDMIVINWFDEASDILDTLISLTADADRRVALLSILYIGIIQELHGKTGAGWSGSRATESIWKTARSTDDKNIGIGAGITLAVLGDSGGISWMARQMQSSGYTSQDQFEKSMRLTLVEHIAEGWK